MQTNVRGRPSKYSATLCLVAEQYIENCLKTGDIPFIEELALQLGLHEDTINEWAKKHKEFSGTIKRLKTLQKLRLQKHSLNRKVHASSAIFLLKANHAMVEEGRRQQAGEQPMTYQDLEGLIDQAERDTEYAPWDEGQPQPYQLPHGFKNISDLIRAQKMN